MAFYKNREVTILQYMDAPSEERVLVEHKEAPGVGQEVVKRGELVMTEDEHKDMIKRTQQQTIDNTQVMPKSDEKKYHDLRKKELTPKNAEGKDLKPEEISGSAAMIEKTTVNDDPNAPTTATNAVSKI